MLSQPRSAVHKQPAKLFQQHWRHLKGNYEFNYAFEKADRFLEQKRTGNQFHYISPQKLKANLCWHLPEENSFNPKISKPPARVPYLAWN
jgi:hypothetical protein